jgi:hypothetical protein
MVYYAKFCDFDSYICNALFSRVYPAGLTSICVYPELSAISVLKFKPERGHYDDLPTLRVLDLVIVDILS